MNIVTALLKYYKFIFFTFFLTLFLFVFIPQSAQALYYLPGTDPFNPNSTTPSCYQPPSEVPIADCITYGEIQPQNQCLQNPWRFYYAARCIASPKELGPACDFSYEYEYNNCDTSDRCYGATTGASGSDSAGRVIPGICNASAYDGSDPNSACTSGGWYKQCCTSPGAIEPTTSCSNGSCPAGEITTAGITSCNAAPPPSRCPAGVQAGQACDTCTSQTCPGTTTACATGHDYCVYDPTNGNYCGGCTTEVNTCSSCTSPASCNVSSWTFSPATPQINSTVSVTVNGTSTPNWTGASYSLDAGSWVAAGSGPPFKFDINSGNAGIHTLRFAINNGTTVCGDTSSVNSFTTQAPVNAASCSGPTFKDSAGNAATNIIAGQNYTATLTMSNPANTTTQTNNAWTTAGNYKLGAQQPQADSGTTIAWGDSNGADSGKGSRPTRVNLPLSPVNPGSSATFSFGVTAPDTAGTYRFSNQMLQENVGWFGGMCAPNITVQASSFTSSCTGTVTNAATRTVQWTASVNPATPPSGSYTYSWSGDESLSGTSASVTKSYSTTGVKNATVTVTNGGTPIPASCRVTITAADLITQSLTYSSPQTTGTNMTFSGIVTNQGNASTGTSFNARFCIDNSSCLTSTSGRVSDHTIAALAANTSSSTITSSGWTATVGNHIIYFCADTGGSIAESDETTNNCSQTSFTVCTSGCAAAPTVSTSSLSCIPAGYTGNGVSISWTNAGVTWVDISRANDVSFSAPYYHEAVTGVTSTTAPNGFNATDGSGPLSLNPATTYYVRTFNGQNSQLANFNIAACGAGCSGNINLNLTPNPANTSATVTAVASNLNNCTNTPITFRPNDCNGSPVASCTSTSSGCSANFSAPSTAGTYTYADCIDKTNPPNGYTDPGESGSTTIIVSPPSSGLCAWIQTFGGDVHSNTLINTPCGP